MSIADIAARIACPVLVLYGEPSRGGMLKPADLERAEQKLAQCKTAFWRVPAT